MTQYYLAVQMPLHPETRILVQRQQDEGVHEGLKESRMQVLDAVMQSSSVLVSCGECAERNTSWQQSLLVSSTTSATGIPIFVAVTTTRGSVSSRSGAISVRTTAGLARGTTVAILTRRGATTVSAGSVLITVAARV